MAKKFIDRTIKFDVHDDFAFPDLTDLTPAGARWELVEYEVEQTYYDSPYCDLDKVGVRLRRRIGGPKPGWQLRSPARKVNAEIIENPVSDHIPEMLARICFGLAGSDVQPVSAVTIKRQIHRLWSRDGVPLIDIADDSVSGHSLDDKTVPSNWHELEMKLRFVTNQRLSNKIGDRLVAAGARHSQWRSKLERSLNGEPEASTSHAHTLGELVTEYIWSECETLLHSDIGLRIPKFVVHESRIAIRRLTSALTVFGPIFDSGRAAHLHAELTWLSEQLEELRDADVVRRRLAVAVQQVAPEFVLGPVAVDIEHTLLAERRRLFADLAEVMVTKRYLALVSDLKAWRKAPPLTKLAQQKVSAGRPYVKLAEEKAIEQLRHARGLEALQEARDAARRLRHATELLENVGTEKIGHTLRTTSELQILLAEHRDALASADVLLRMGQAADKSRERNGFTYGLLLARERERADHVRFELSKRWA